MVYSTSQTGDETRSRAVRGCAASRRECPSVPAPLGRVNPIDRPARTNLVHAARAASGIAWVGIRASRRWPRIWRSDGETPRAVPAAIPPTSGEIQARQGHGPVGDHAMRRQRTDEQADPEEGDENAKHADPFFRVYRGHRNAPVGIHEGIGGTVETVD